MRLSSWMCAIGTAALVAGCGSESGSQASAPTTGDEVNVELHDHPTREELAEVLGEQAAHIRDCGPGTGETVRVEIVFEGTSGQPIEINYPDDVARSTRICIESNLVHAVVQPFRQDRFSVTYPFKLRESASATPPVGDSDG
jgi:hypothetical protein